MVSRQRLPSRPVDTSNLRMTIPKSSSQKTESQITVGFVAHDTLPMMSEVEQGHRAESAIFLCAPVRPADAPYADGGVSRQRKLDKKRADG